MTVALVVVEPVAALTAGEREGRRTTAPRAGEVAAAG